MRKEESFIRISIILFLCASLFIYLFYVLFKLQILQHDNYSKTRDIQNKIVDMVDKRGTIFATRKDGELIPLAEDEVWYKLVLIPKQVNKEYEDRLFSILNEITDLKDVKFYEKVKNKKDPYEELKVISKNEAEKIEKLNLAGIKTYKTFKRVYPMNDAGARIVGFIGSGSDNNFVGRYGLEKQYQNDLTSKKTVKENFFAKIFEKNNKDEVDTMSKNIVTSLEPNVMKFINKVLMETKEQWGADEVSAIVMNAKTGEIIAMETVPEFDPNNFKNYEIKDFKNPSVQSVYELGSIMKPITLAGGIQAGLVNPQTPFRDLGYVKIDNYTIKNFDEKVRGDVTMQDVISQSLNTGIVYVQRLLGKEKFKDNFKKFGLEDTTEIDFPGEVINKTDNLEGNTDVNFATASFGQGVAVTPISMLSSLSILSNSGKTLCPHFLVSKIFQDNSSMGYECENAGQEVVSTTTANTMKQMMVELIDTGLANGRFKDKNYKVGAKTGTAQLPSPDGKYYKDKFIHTYFTFFPAENPKFTVLVYQVNPKKGLLASITLAPLASRIKDFLLTYYSIPPDRQ